MFHSLLSLRRFRYLGAKKKAHIVRFSINLISHLNIPTIESFIQRLSLNGSTTYTLVLYTSFIGSYFYRVFDKVFLGRITSPSIPLLRQVTANFPGADGKWTDAASLVCVYNIRVLIAFRGRIPRALLGLPYWSVYCCCTRCLEAPNASHNVLPAKTVKVWRHRNDHYAPYLAFAPCMPFLYVSNSCLESPWLIRAKS